MALVMLAWLALTSLFAALTARSAMERAREELNATGVALHRVISQRVSQHDAHLTSLIALVLATDPPPQDAIRLVAQNIIRFYPRIASINLVALGTGDAGVWLKPVVAIPQQAGAPDHAAFAASIFQQRPGQARAYFDPATPSLYLLGKKANAADPALAILMEIDAGLLVEPDERPGWAHMVLSLDGQVVAERPAEQAAEASTWLSAPRFSRMIDSQSQPLLLSLDRPLVLADIINPKLTLGFAGLSLVGLLILHYAWRQRRAARRSHDAALAAEQRTQLLERETRLAHASRVNSLGELASGITHELTQPLTALLSQSQAALRLSSSGQDPTLLHQALEANVREAKRAGRMLDRMRDYISNRDPRRALTDLNQVATEVSELLRADLDKRHITLALDLQAPPPRAIVDPIELEQVLHNLIRNAADSLDASQVPEKRISISTATDGSGHAIVRVADNGPGIPPDVLPRLFEPFFTTKANGMGLGLSLCATLVERVGGAIEAGSAKDGGASFTVTLPASGQTQQAAQ